MTLQLSLGEPTTFCIPAEFNDISVVVISRYQLLICGRAILYSSRCSFEMNLYSYTFVNVPAVFGSKHPKLNNAELGRSSEVRPHDRRVPDCKKPCLISISKRHTEALQRYKCVRVGVDGYVPGNKLIEASDVVPDINIGTTTER